MPAIWGNIIVIALLVVVVVSAARFLWKSHRAGRCCTGDCASCGGCHRCGCKR